MMAMPIKPILLALLVFLSFKGVYNAPRAPPRPEEQKKYGKQDLIERLLQLGIPTCQIMVVSLAACEAAVLVASAYPGPLSDTMLSLLVYREHACISSVTLTPAWLVGCGLCVSGALLRMYCYRILGPQYTFERSVIKEHELVTTGPYAVVRHPAYTGFEAFHVGLLMVQLGRGSWAWECGVMGTWAGRVIVAGWVWYVYKLVDAVFRRCAAEDETLSNEFGEKWVRWSRKTPARLVPGIY